MSNAGPLSIEGSAFKAIEIVPDKNSGLDDILVVRDLDNVKIIFSGTSLQNPVVSTFTYAGGTLDMLPVTDITVSGNSIIINRPKGDIGYVIENGSAVYRFWVVDYKNHIFSASKISAAEQQDCEFSILAFEGNAQPIYYFSINGNRETLSREITLEYTTQQFDSESSDYINVDVENTLASISELIYVTPPAYCSTYFVLSGDRFLREWNQEAVIESNVIQPMAIQCQTEAVQTNISSEEDSNVIKGPDSALGGSAPADITFYSYTTQAVVYHEWQMSRDPEFNNLEYRFYQKDLDYTFNEEGSFYVRYLGSNSEGTCEIYGDTYQVHIGSSELVCPNAFSPNGDGVNDIWKVSYRSLIDFNCEIFNRNGQRIYSFTDPNDGWDGTWHGKKVKSGVYYYVITATGADGHKYKKSGDINIINSTLTGGSTAPSPEEPSTSPGD